MLDLLMFLSFFTWFYERSSMPFHSCPYVLLFYSILDCWTFVSRCIVCLCCTIKILLCCIRFKHVQNLHNVIIISTKSNELYTNWTNRVDKIKANELKTNKKRNHTKGDALLMITIFLRLLVVLCIHKFYLILFVLMNAHISTRIGRDVMACWISNNIYLWRWIYKMNSSRSHIPMHKRWARKNAYNLWS